MANSNFVDYVKIHIRSGRGGGGSAHLHREKFTPKGGPDGGDGGRGGHIIIRASKDYWTLLHLKYDRHIFAGNGMSGSHSRSFGADGADKVIEVPCGTVVYDAQTGEYLMDVTEDGEQKILLKGGRGGLGNWHFKSATNRTPRFAQSGEPGQERIVILELKVLADVGLVGKPNAGKSTLLSSISAAKPKIADYPFTTLVPNLGIVAYRDGKSFCMADIPGIIEGASEGKGLGYRFLRHIERNAILCFLVPVDTDDIVEEYNLLLKELEAYNPELLEKQRVLCLSKSDMLDDELKELIAEQLPKDIKYCFISSVVGSGLMQLKDMLWEMIQNNTHEVESITHRNLDADKIRNDFDDDEDFSIIDESPNEDDYDEYEWDEELYDEVMSGKTPSKFLEEESENEEEEELVDYVEDEEDEEIVDYIEDEEDDENDKR